MLEISIIILTYNEELHIKRCIESVCSIATEVFLVDSFSNDQTIEIARSLGVNIFQHAWPGNQAEQLNLALANLPGFCASMPTNTCYPN